MASISKLSVRGVRAFSPDDEEQVISFYNPLTIIVGANGCGKTTIIEALKYAVCGSLPPGVRSGQAFVHDPKSVGQSSVKANIKLRFANRAGKSMVVIRSMEVVQKKTTLTFKALDGILRTTDPETGERVSLSHKCSELDRQIPALMGISKAILESVVFCHQEEASWPLQEGSVLKKKFDDIFESTRYSKALEAIRKTRIEYQGVCKDLKADLSGLSSHKHASEGFLEELDVARDELGKIDETIAKHGERVEREGQELVKYKAALDEMCDLRNKADDHRSDLERDSAIAASKKSMLEEDWTGAHTHEQLRAMLGGFDDVIRTDQHRRDECERKVQHTKSEMDRLRQITMQLNNAIGKLDSEREANEAVVRQRARLVEELAERYELEELTGITQRSMSQGTHATGRRDISGTIGTQQSALSAVTNATGVTMGRPSLASNDMGALSQESLGTFTAEDMTLVMKAIKEKEQQLREDLDHRRRSSQKAEDKLQETLRDLEARMQNVDTEKQRLVARRSNAQSELSKISLHSAGISRIRKSDIEEVKRQAAKYSKQRDELNKDARKDVIPKEIKAHADRIENLKHTIDDDSIALRDLRQGAENQTAIDMLRHQVTQDAESLEEALKENAYLLQKHGVQPNTNRFGTNQDGVDCITEEMKVMAEKTLEKYDNAAHDKSRRDEELQAKERVVSEKNALLKHNKLSLDKLRGEAEALGVAEQRIRRIHNLVVQFEARENMAPAVEPNANAQALLQHLSEQLKEYSKEEDPLIISLAMKRLKKLAQQKTDERGLAGEIICPCCLRSMDRAETKAFSDQIKVLSDPNKSPLLREEAGWIKAYKTNYETWHKSVQNSMSDYLDFRRITADLEGIETSVKEGEEDLKRLQSELDVAKESADHLRDDVAELRQVLEVANRLRDDADRICDKSNQIQTKEDELAMVAPSSHGRDLKTVEREIQARMDEKDTLTQSITKLNRELSALNEQISRVTNQAAKAEQMARDKEKKFTQEQEASVKKNELNEVIANCTQEERKLGEEIAPLRQKFRMRDGEKQRMRSTVKAEEDRLNGNLNQFNADVRKLSDLSTRIDGYSQSDKPKELERVTLELSDIADKQSEGEKTLAAMGPKLESLNKKVNDQERHKKTINNNIELLEILKEIEKKKRQLSELEEEIEAVEESDTSEKDLQAVQKRIAQLENARAQCEGRRSVVKDQIRSLKERINLF